MPGNEEDLTVPSPIDIASTLPPAPLLTSLTLRPGYRTGTDNLVDDFYIPCLSAAKTYDRAVGYFRSTLYTLVGLAFSSFAIRKGHARVICSPHLFTEDIEAIREGERLNESADQIFKASLEAVLASDADLPVVRFLATLIAHGTLSLQIAYKPGKAGIYHNKVGIFEDNAKNRVSFLGSVNETFSAWSADANHEGFEVFRDWTSESDRERVQRHHDYFSALWAGTEPDLTVEPVSSANLEMLLAHADPEGVDAAAEKVRQVVSRTRHRKAANVTGRAAITLHDHQREAIASWFLAERGLVKHATGSGKTITALEIVARWLQSKGPAVVLVPSSLLASQWREELLAYLGDARPHVLEVGGSNSDLNWREYLADFTRAEPSLGPRVVIATLQSASSPAFVDRVCQGNHLLVVADEVHRTGSQGYRSLFSLNAGGRLGLSATPERYGDPEGTAAVFDYFGPILKPEFTLADALAARRLVPYDYHVHAVPLSDEEHHDWESRTATIRREYARLPKENGNPVLTSYLRNLLIQRARILKSAAAKTPFAVDLLAAEMQQEDRWLVYCDNEPQLRAVHNGLRERGLPAFEYHSQMHGSRDATLRHFTEAGGVLVAIKCLDEGVDIPVVNAAVILASSRNPREFIQRRGRVLRRAPNKFSAQVHDAIVVPRSTSDEDVDIMENATRGELRRAWEFAQSARNAACRHEIAEIASDYGVALTPADTDAEEDETE